MKKHKLIKKLCENHTDLSDEDVLILINISSRISDVSKQDNVDVFIDCPCKNPGEAIVIEQVSKEGSLYELSTVGYIIREEDEPAVFRSFRLGIKTEGVKALTYASTANNLVVQNVAPIKNGDRIIGALVFESEFKPIEETYTNTEPQINKICTNANEPFIQNVDWLAECIQDAVIIVNEEGKVCFRNTVAQTLYADYGYINDILDVEYWKISLHGELTVGPIKEQDYEQQELVLKGKYYLFKQFRFHSEHVFYVVIIRDISDIKQSERMRHQKTSMLREIHHQVKNNLYIVHSLLDLQKRRVESAEAAVIIQDAMNRITSIAATYETLQEKDQDSVSLKKMINRIVMNFSRLVGEENITITVEGNDVSIDSNTSASVSLVINELLQNCYKHAFLGKAGGNIHINVKEDLLHTIIEVYDDGVGFEVQSFASKKDRKNLGLQIVEILVKDKLKGRLNVASGPNGTTVKFDFKTSMINA